MTVSTKNKAIKQLLLEKWCYIVTKSPAATEERRGRRSKQLEVYTVLMGKKN